MYADNILWALIKVIEILEPLSTTFNMGRNFARNFQVINSNQNL